MSKKMWVEKNGQSLGPYSVEEVRRYVQSGRLVPGDPAAWEGDAEWSELGKLVALSAEPARPTGRPKNLISYKEAIRAPKWGGLGVSLATVVVTSLVVYFLSGSSGLVICIWGAVAYFLGMVPIICLERIRVKPKKRLKRYFESELASKFNAPSSLKEIIGGKVQEYGNDLLEESVAELNVTGAILGYGASKLGHAISDTPEGQERRKYEKKISKIEEAIKRTSFAYSKSMLLASVGCLAAGKIVYELSV